MALQGSRVVPQGANALRSSLAAPTVSFRRGMATEAQIKQRMLTVRQIQKITKAMKLVAAAKLRGTQNHLEAVNNFAAGPLAVWPKTPDALPTTAKLPSGQVLVVPITSDRGLCGSANVTVTRRTKNTLDKFRKDKVNVIVATIGNKAKTALERLYGKHLALDIADCARAKFFNFKSACLMMDEYNKLDWTRIDVIYNRFKNLVSFETTVFQLPSFETQAAGLNAAFGGKYDLEDGGYQTPLLSNLHAFHGAVGLYSCIQNTIACETSSRMTAMTSSSKAAGEMAVALQLLYNRTRQNKITKELLEVITGVTAMAKKSE